MSLIRLQFQQRRADSSIAGTLLLSDKVHQRAEETLVPRP